MLRDPVILCVLAAQPGVWLYIGCLIAGYDRPWMLFASLGLMAAFYGGGLWLARHELKSRRNERSEHRDKVAER